MKKKPVVGAKVRFTGDYLRATCQYTGSDAFGAWFVLDCSCGLCQGGPFVMVNEPSTYGEGMRHINWNNLEVAP